MRSSPQTGRIRRARGASQQLTVGADAPLGRARRPEMTAAGPGGFSSGKSANGLRLCQIETAASTR